MERLFAIDGDVLVFFDADVRLAPSALERLLAAREQCGGVVSVVPYHHMERPYEKLSLWCTFWACSAFTSPLKRRTRKGVYGSCVVATREDYERVSGHEGVSGEVLDDLNLGRKFTEAGIPVDNHLGGSSWSSDVPRRIRSELQGFGRAR